MPSTCFPERHLVHILILSLAFLFAWDAVAQDQQPEVSSGLKIIGAPYLLGNSDDGLTVGYGIGFNRASSLYAILAGEYSTSGQLNLMTETEYQRQDIRFVNRISFNRGTRGLYPSLPVDPDPLVTAKVERFEFRLSALRSGWENVEFGPSLWVETAKGLDPEDDAANPVTLSDYSRFVPAAVAMGGARFRWLTTSAVRPLDGYVVDLSLLGGAAWSNEWSDAKPDANLQASAAYAYPVSDWALVYLRGMTQWQWNAPEPVRVYNGGDRRVRGQPRRRELGRRGMFTRAQTHFTVMHDWRWPLETANRILPFLPVYGLDLELVPFYDMGVIADPEFGWLRARHGVGAGLHIVIPPELVVRIDVGVSPGGSPRFYFTVGESI